MFNFSFVSFERKRSSTSLMKRTQVGTSIAFQTKREQVEKVQEETDCSQFLIKKNIINISINSFTQDTRTHSCTKLCFCCPEVFIINFLFPFHHKLFSFILISSTILRSNNLFPIQSCSFLFPLLFSFVVQSIVYLVYNISDLPKIVVNNTKRLFSFMGKISNKDDMQK